MPSFAPEAMKEYTTTRQLMERYSVPGLVLRLGVPAMVGQVFNLLYSIVDRIFVGRIPGTGEQALAAIGICAPALTAISAFAYMVGIGGASLMSISLGQGNQRRAQQALGNAFWLVIAIAVAVTAVLLPLHRPLLYLLGCSDALYPYAGAYFTIYLLGTVASLLGVGMNQFLLAQGYARQGMIAVVLGALANLVLDPLLIFGCGLGVRGAAAATVLSQCAMAVYVLYQLRRPGMPVRLRPCRPESALCRRIVAIGSMSFLITLLDNLIIILLNIVLRRYGGAQGDAWITGATVVQSFLTIVFCPSQGITTGCGTLFSYNYGAGNVKKVRQSFLWVFVLCAAYIGLMELAVQTAPAWFAGLFLQDETLLTMASLCLRRYTLVLLGVAVQYALVDGLTAMGKVRYAFPLSVFRKLVYLGCLFLLPRLGGVEAVFYAGSLSDLIGAGFSDAGTHFPAPGKDRQRWDDRSPGSDSPPENSAAGGRNMTAARSSPSGRPSGRPNWPCCASSSTCGACGTTTCSTSWWRPRTVWYARRMRTRRTACSGCSSGCKARWPAGSRPGICSAFWPWPSWNRVWRI